MERQSRAYVGRFWKWTLAIGVAAGLLAVAPTSIGLPPDPVVRVEQDWVLVLNEPEGALTAPQFHTVLSPSGDVSGVYTQVTWNYRELPEFDAGGVEMQIWDGEDYVFERSFASISLSTEAETIRWTQVLETTGDELVFTIVNGSSETWGSFGHPVHNMQIRYSTPVPDLSGYSTSVSRSNSVITFGSNRVNRLGVSQVRRVTSSGAVYVEAGPDVFLSDAGG